MREVHVGVGVQVGRGLYVVRGAVVRGGAVVFGAVVLGGAVVRGAGDVVFELVRGVEVFDDVEEDVADDEVELVDAVDKLSLDSSRRRSSTGGGSEGAAATRNPRSTSSGTQSSAARRIPSRPMRRRGVGFMATSLGRRHESGVRVG